MKRSLVMRAQTVTITSQTDEEVKHSLFRFRSIISRGNKNLKKNWQNPWEECRHRYQPEGEETSVWLWFERPGDGNVSVGNLKSQREKHKGVSSSIYTDSNHRWREGQQNKLCPVCVHFLGHVRSFLGDSECVCVWSFHLKKALVSPEVALLQEGRPVVGLRVSMRVSGWRRRPWSLHRWGWCTVGSAASAGGNTARWTWDETGPDLQGPGHNTKIQNSDGESFVKTAESRSRQGWIVGGIRHQVQNKVLKWIKYNLRWHITKWDYVFDKD